MALFMEVYRGAGLTEGDVRRAHEAQRGTTRREGIRYLRYWWGAQEGRVTCLVEAPAPEALYRADSGGPLPVPEVTELFASAARWAAVEAVD